MKACSQCQQPFFVTEQDQAFYQRIGVPTPTKCPNCRLKLRLAFWPFGRFHQRADSLTGKPLISVFSSTARFPVTDRNNWYSDTWEAPSKTFDVRRPFFDQLKELQEVTPHFHMLGDDKNVNCDYCDDVWSCRDCYYSRSMYKVEQSYYVYRLIESRDCLDCTFSFSLEHCYENTYCFNNYNTSFALDSRNCLDCAFVYDCRGTRNCFMCWNVRNKQYCIRNQQYSQAEYQRQLATIDFTDPSILTALKKEWKQHLQQDAIHRATYTNNSERVTGNYLDHCQNVTNSFFTEQSENCHHMFRNLQDKDCVDNTGLLIGELCYETVQSSYLYNCKFCSFSIRCNNSEYLDECIDVDDCFGCVGLKKKNFCILNTPYTESEYKRLKAKIVGKMINDGEYGHFLPYSMAYTDYDESLVAYYFPQSQAEAKATQPRPFNMIDRERAFYKQHGLAEPTLHPDERNLQRFRQMAGIIPYVVHCYQCQQSITTYYGPEFKYNKIVCEKCYQKEIY